VREENKISDFVNLFHWECEHHFITLLGACARKTWGAGSDAPVLLCFGPLRFLFFIFTKY